MEEQWQCDRATLCQLLRDHPEYSHRQLAAAQGRSMAFVKNLTLAGIEGKRGIGNNPLFKRSQVIMPG